MEAYFRVGQPGGKKLDRFDALMQVCTDQTHNVHAVFRQICVPLRQREGREIDGQSERIGRIEGIELTPTRTF